MALRRRRRRARLKPGWDVEVHFRPNDELERSIRAEAAARGGQSTGSGTDLHTGVRDVSFLFADPLGAADFHKAVRRLRLVQVASIRPPERLADNPRRPPKSWWRGCVRGVTDSGSADDPESVCGALWYRKMSEAQRRKVLRSEGKMDENPSRITVAERPYTLTFLATGRSYPLTSEEAQRLLNEYPAVKATKNRVVLQGHNTPDPRQRTVLTPATRGGGPAFHIGRTMNSNPRKRGYDANCATCGPAALAPNPNGGGLLLLAGAAAVGLWFLLRSKPAAAAEGSSCSVNAPDLDAWATARGYSGWYLPQQTEPPTNVPQAILDSLNAGNQWVVVLGDGSFWVYTDPGGNALPVLGPAPAQRQDFCEWVAAGKPATGLPPGGPASCPLNQGNLDAWGTAAGVPVIYLPGAAEVTPALLSTIPTLPQILASGDVPVFVVQDGSFWTVTYDPATASWFPAPAPAQKEAYCAWVAAQGQTAPPPQSPPAPSPSPIIAPAAFDFTPIAV